MRSGLAKYINSIHEIAFIFCFFLLLLSLHFFSILSFFFLRGSLACSIPLCFVDSPYAMVLSFVC